MSDIFTIVNFYERINYAYKQRGLSDRDIEKLTGISKSYVHKLRTEKGSVKISRAKLRDLSKVLQVDPIWLETGYGFPYPDKFQVVYPFKAMNEGDEDFYHVLIEGQLNRMSQSDIESMLNLKPGGLPDCLNNYEKFAHSKEYANIKHASHIVAEDRESYDNIDNSVVIDAEFHKKFSALDNRQKQRILADIDEMILLRKLKEQVDRAQRGGEERHISAIPPQPKKGRQEPA